MTIDLLFRQHRAHGRERRFDHGVVALVLQPELAQHGAGGDVDRAAGGVGADDLALEILRLLDRPVGEHEIFLGVVAGHAVAELVGDHADIVEAGVLNGDAERGIGEVGDLELAVGHRGDHRRRALVAHRLEHIRLAEVLGRGPFSPAVSTPSWRPAPPRRRGFSRDRRFARRWCRAARRQGQTTGHLCAHGAILLVCPRFLSQLPATFKLQLVRRGTPDRHDDHGDASSSTRPLVSTANSAVMSAATTATAANVTKTEGKSGIWQG